MENDSHGNDVNIKQNTYTGADGQKWKVERLSNGAYRITAKLRELNNRSLAVGWYAVNVDGVNIQQRDYVDNGNDKADWYLEPVILEGQRKNQWCWVTSARMLAHYYYSGVTRTQGEAVSNVFGTFNNPVSNNENPLDNSNNIGGVPANAQTAINYYLGNISGASLTTKATIDEIYSEATLRRFLDDGHVIYIRRGQYPNGGTTRVGGHATLIYGYTQQTVNGVVQYRYKIYDPWPANNTTFGSANTGQVRTWSYAKICNGRNAITANSEETPDNSIWDGFVVVQTSYSGNTITPVWN